MRRRVDANLKEAPSTNLKDRIAFADVSSFSACLTCTASSYE
jgi:hypothetical protein